MKKNGKKPKKVSKQIVYLYHDSKFGNYSCEAKNKFGTVSKNIELRRVNAAKVISNFRNIKILFNETANVRCDISGVPWPKFSWKLNGTVISSNHNLTLDNKLKSGVLTCAAENVAGSDEKSFKFEIILD